jgi:large subunit ribosomal protein L3
MSIGVIGRKVGMTRIFFENGESVPVTVVEVKDNRVAHHKTVEKDGYSAIQVAFGEKKDKRLSKPLIGHYAKAGVKPGAILREFRLSSEELGKFSVQSVIPAETFAPGQKVDVTGVTKGRGFAGVIRRHNFSYNRASHGNSLSHNPPGSIGQRQDPGRVFPGKKMAGHYGNERVTVQNLEVVRVDNERGLLWIKGGVPGAREGFLIVRPAVKG